MRQIKTHEVNECNKQLKLSTADEPGIGGANHRYSVVVPHGPQRAAVQHLLEFQDGPINEVGVNGLTHEVLIAIVIDRLEGFQRGPYACYQNAEAIKALESARTFLNSRTTERMARGVEGTHEV